MRSWLSFFILEICILLLMSSTQGQEFDEQMSDPYFRERLPGDEHVPESFSASDHQVHPHNDQRRDSNRESVSLDSMFHHRHSNRRADHENLMQPEKTAETDLTSLTVLHRGSKQIGDMDSNIPGSEFSQSVKSPRHNRRYRKRKSASSSAFLGRISPDYTPSHRSHLRERGFKSTESQEQPGNFGEFRDTNQQSDFPNVFRPPEHHPFVPDSNFETQKIYQSDSSSPTGRLGAELHSEDHSADDSFYGNEKHPQHSQTGSILSSEREQQLPSHRYLQHRNPEFQADDSLLRHQDMLPRRRIPGHSAIADGGTYSEHETSLRSESFENEQPVLVPQVEALESDQLGSFPSNRRMEQQFFQHPERLLRNEDDNEWHQQRYDSESSVPEAEREDILQNQQDGDEDLFLDICSEDTHTFYNGEISSSSPLYEIEALLPPNFNEIFRRELVQKFRPYEHPDLGDRESVCNPNLRFDGPNNTNLRAMCPFEWEVSSYNPSRYPPYLMTARCTCQLSKPLYKERSACKEKKGQMRVLWRVGCINGKHVYREGWEEINVACIPEGYTLTRGEEGSESNNFHKPTE